MTELFPLRQADYLLVLRDFLHFQDDFSRTIVAAIPTARKVSFPQNSEELLSELPDEKSRNAFNTLYSNIVLKKKIGGFLHDSLLLALPLANAGVQIAHIQQIDELLVHRAGWDWLVETHRDIVARLQLSKKAYLDIETGLPNAAYLLEMVQSAPQENARQILLVELPPRRKLAREAYIHVQKAAAALQSFCYDYFALHHLGQCVFALYADGPVDFSLNRFASSLVSYLKNEGFPRVHAGSSSQPACGADPAMAVAAEQLLDQAWTALQEAGRRGPFGFCDYATISSADHAVNCWSAKDWRRLLTRAKSLQSFSLLLFSAGTIDGYCIRELLMAANKEAVVFAASDCAGLLLPDCAVDKAVEQGRKLLADLNRQLDAPALYAGVAAFPHQRSLPRQILANASKALRHASFFGAGACVAFDAVSCNIAGDEYFSEGNLPFAVREYLAGLSIDSTNVNLLNSLGVTYALLSRNAAACKCFEQVLASEANNYMALCNLGYIAQQRKQPVAAISYFSRALPWCPVDSEDQHERQVARDLHYHLGRLYCQTSQYAAALPHLQQWQQTSSNEKEQQKVLRYLGEALQGCGRTREAMVILQQAVNGNPRDYDALSLLGCAIMQEREGDAIALAFCRKSVELEPTQPLLRLRLAEVELACGNFAAALGHGQRLRRVRQLRQPVAALLARIYEQLGQAQRARAWAEKSTHPNEQVLAPAVKQV